MKTAEIVKAIREQSPKLLGKMPDKKVAQIINAALKQIQEEVSTASAGRVAVPGLGVFVLKTIEREKDGVKRTVDRVFFKVPPQGKKQVKAAE